ncbi:MAG: histidine--tRNA ligase, partial [Flavobacteriales bacterium]
MAKLNTPKGTRDFLPEQVARRNYIFQTVKDVFDTFGFSPIETPAMELKETLMGKYGEEGDRLIFKILARGDKLKKALSNDSEAQLSEEALRYDLTVPFARFVVQHQNDLSFPFKRYQIQPVWRADRPQKGRYREFYQCDVDMIGSDSLLNEVELIQLVSEVFTKLKLPEATIKLNNRKILEGIAQVIGEPEKLIDITVALDKLDKIGREKV